jgi:hypothetical protein
MTRRHATMLRPRPAGATVLYALGLLSLLVVALALGEEETTPARWTLLALPVVILGAASLLARRVPRPRQR